MSAVGLAIGAMGVGTALSSAGQITNLIGSRINTKNAPDKLRSKGNFVEALETDNLIPYLMTYQVNDFEKVADTYEKTGYRVDIQTNDMFQSLNDFIKKNDINCRQYFYPVQVTAVDISFTVCAPEDVREDIQARFANGIRFYPPYLLDPSISVLSENLQYDNLEV